jgi:hypothetical protein
VALSSLIYKNKYTKWHNLIIKRALSRALKKGVGVEEHHILPRSLGGDNSIKNKVNLYAREHFIIHLLLVKMLKKKKHIDSMTYALFNMKANNEYYTRNNNSKMYHYFKERFQKLQSKRMTKYMSKKENRKNISEKRKAWFQIKENRDHLSKVFTGRKRPEMNKQTLLLKGDNRTKKQKQASLEHSNKMKGRIPWNKGLTSTSGIINARNISR